MKVGEPGFPVAAAERGQEVVVSLHETFAVGDHDFTHFSIIPSVVFHLTLLKDHGIQWNPSITDTIGNQLFVCYGEVSPTQRLPVYFR